MIVDFAMPMLGEVMEEGTIISWHKKEGESVNKGEILLDVETDKATMEVESNTSGIVKELLNEEGETVPVHTVIARIEIADE